MEEVISVWDVARVVNVLLAVYVLSRSGLLWAWWDGQAKSLRILLLGLLSVLAVVGWGSIEALIDGVRGGSRVALFTPALAWAAWGITLLARERRALARPISKEKSS